MASQAKTRAGPLTGGALWAAGVLLALANFVAVLDLSIANVSVPNISGALGASTSQGVWIITSYAVAEAITVPLTGWLAGRFGAVRTFAMALIGFGLASALCGLAPSLGLLVAFRVIQGVCGGPLMALSQTLLLQIFPPKQQPAAMGLWAVTTLVAPVCGPILGGYLCDTFGWGSIFMVNVPVAILAGVLVWRTLFRYEGETRKAPFDAVGLGLLIVWIAALQILLDLGKELDWFQSPTIVALGVTAAIFAAFMIWELTQKHPIVNLKVFRHRGFSASMVTLTLTMGAFFATNVLTPLWLQSNMGYTATWAGYVTGLIGILAIVSAPITAQAMTKTDPRRILFAGVCWLAFTTFMRSHGMSQMTFWQIGVWLFVAGAAMPMFFLPVTTVALGAVNPEETADASGLLNFLRTVAGAVATSIVSTVWENNATRNHADLAATMPQARATVDSLTGSSMSSGAALATVNDIVGGQAVMLATNQLFLACAMVFAIAAALVWITPRPTREVDTSAAH